MINKILILVIVTTSTALIKIRQNASTLKVAENSEGLYFTLERNGIVKLSGELGVGINISDVKGCVGIPSCLIFENKYRLHITEHLDNGFRVLWRSENPTATFTDCFSLNSTNLNWYGGPERTNQSWPIEKLVLTDFANVLQESNFSAVVEPYWLNSAGAYIFVDELTPLFINQNNFRTNAVCFSAKVATPYLGRNKVILSYTIVVADNPRTAHLHAVQHFLGKPKGHPNIKMIERPIWSTWAKFKTAVDDDTVLKFAQDIVDNGYRDGQFELDDDWEKCYGALTFNTNKFEHISNTVAELKQMGFRVTLWVHPFVNTNCKDYTQIGNANGFFVRNKTGSALTQWWNSGPYQAQYLDFTNAEVCEWFVDRLRLLQTLHDIDSFKFDAGETSWSPPNSIYNDYIDKWPNIISSAYVRTCATFGDLVEVRSAWKTQDLPIFLRMIDKNSEWGDNAGLYTLITTLLQLNMNGYTMVLPDMIGGNGYGNYPSAELFVRWLQANVFMPSIQFSFVPWNFKNDSIDVINISKKYVTLHQEYANYIIKAMNESITLGHPVNAPIWWVAPNDTNALKEDTEFLLGEDILVAPVITEGARQRDVYLPAGHNWIDGNDGHLYTGGQFLRQYPAPIEKLPYFIREGSNLAKKNLTQ